MNPKKYAITFACYNKAGYTRQCVNSMIKHYFDISKLIVVDNFSTDDTSDYLTPLPLRHVDTWATREGSVFWGGR